MALLSNRTGIFSGDTTAIDTSAKHKMLTRAFDVSGNEYIYLAGCASTIVGSWVTYDELGATTLLAADAVGPVAVAMAITDSTSEYGWYCIFGQCEADLVANVADNANLCRETTNGKAGDVGTAGDVITGAVCRDTVTTAAVATVQLCYPSVNDKSA